MTKTLDLDTDAFTVNPRYRLQWEEAQQCHVLLYPEDYVDVSPADAERFTISSGQQVRVRSRYGEARLSARVTPSVKPGEVFATFHSPQTLLNMLTSDRRDSVVGTPEFKVTAVRVEPA